MAESCDSPLTFLKTCQTVFKDSSTIFHSHRGILGFQFPHALISVLSPICTFDWSHLREHEVISKGDFTSYFSYC